MTKIAVADKLILMVVGALVGAGLAAIAASFYPPTYVTLSDSVFELYEVLRAAGVFGGLLVGLKIADRIDPKRV